GKLRQPVGEAKGEADAAADHKADACAPEADPDVAAEFTRNGELPARQRHIAWRRQHARRHKARRAGKLPDAEDHKRDDPRDKPIGARQIERAYAWNTLHNTP